MKWEEFIKIVDEVKKERAKQEPKSIFRKKWFWLSSGTIVAAAVTSVFMLTKGGSGEPAVRLPDPPGFPGN